MLIQIQIVFGEEKNTTFYLSYISFLFFWQNHTYIFIYMFSSTFRSTLLVTFERALHMASKGIRCNKRALFSSILQIEI